LRQAYDYWQNQPGNYLDAGAAPRDDDRGSTPEGQKVAIGRGEDASRPGHGRHSPVRKRLPRPSIAPLEFPKGGPPQRSAQPVWALKVLRSTPSRGGCPGRSRRPRSTATDQGLPRKSGEILSHRPIIHRPQRTRRARAFRGSVASNPHRPHHDSGFVLVGDRRPWPWLERVLHAQPAVQGHASMGK